MSFGSGPRQIKLECIKQAVIAHNTDTKGYSMANNTDKIDRVMKTAEIMFNWITTNKEDDDDRL